LNDYFFQVKFSTATTDNFLRVPISAFAEKVGRGGGNYDCNVNINYLDNSNQITPQIIFGGMFFQEFFGVFYNDYHDTSSVDQGAQIYVGQNSLYNAYVGSTVLPTGTNPFVPTPPTPPTPSDDSGGLTPAWITVLALIGALLIAFLAWTLYRYKVVQNKKTVRGSNVVYGTDGQVNASGTANTSGLEVSKEEQKLLEV